MLQIVASKCPRCNNLSNGLLFWKQVGDKYFYVCSSCKKTPMSEEDLLNIGFHWGRENFRTEIRNLLDNQRGE